MKFYTQLLKSLLLVLLLIELSGCGYKPSAKFSREILGKKISTNIIISAQDPENTVLIKDTVDQAIIDVFHSSLVDRKYADTHLEVKISNPSYSPLQYNDNGFIISNRATITLMIRRESENLTKSYTSVGNYDFSVVPNAVLTNQERFDAIKYSATKAIASFVAQVSAEGSRKN